MTKWKHVNKKRSHTHLSYSHYYPIPISLTIWFPTPREFHGRDGNPAFPIPMHISTHNDYVFYSLENLTQPVGFFRITSAVRSLQLYLI